MPNPLKWWWTAAAIVAVLYYLPRRRALTAPLLDPFTGQEPKIEYQARTYALGGIRAPGGL